MPILPSDQTPSSTNMALFARFSDPEFLISSIETCFNSSAENARILFSDNQQLSDALRTFGSLDTGDIKLDTLVFDTSIVLGAVQTILNQRSEHVTLLVDLSWITDALNGSAYIEAWSAVAERLCADNNCVVVSMYNLDLLVENRMQAALRAHSHLLSPSGVHDNPFWLPTALTTRGTFEEQMAFLLGRVVPDYKDMTFFDKNSNRSFARGTNLHGLPAAKHIQVLQTTQKRWRIHCLGPLCVLNETNQRVDWKIRGGSANKSRTLFAYLLHAGEKGAQADRIAELLWPHDLSEKVKRARLHHAVAMLRKTLGSIDSVLRSGEYYQLNAPAGSWTDMSSFEQTCRRGLTLFKQGLEEEALRIYLSAERQYGGELFEDIPVEYVHNELDDWCLPRRRWLQEMAIKLFTDMSVLLRGQGRTDEALEKCQKALALDPAGENANSEAMRIFHAQERMEAITRQYQQYVVAAEAIGSTSAQAGIHGLHRVLTH